MSANYWASTQRHKWQMTRAELQEARLKVREWDFHEGKISSIDDDTMYDNMRLYFHTLIRQLGQQMNIRQRALGTAEVYLTRFFLRTSFYEINAYVIVATCVYVACKTEECPQHIRTITNEARDLWPDYVSTDPTKIAECEFYLIEELDSYLIVYHPYRSLMQLIENMGKTNNQLAFMKDETQYAWSIINDSYATDMMLLYPPHIIATAALYITIVRSRTMRAAAEPSADRFRLFQEYLGHCGIDLEKVVEAMQELISLYVRWETCDENGCKLLLANQINGSP